MAGLEIILQRQDVQVVVHHGSDEEIRLHWNVDQILNIFQAGK